MPLEGSQQWYEERGQKISPPWLIHLSANVLWRNVHTLLLEYGAAQSCCTMTNVGNSSSCATKQSFIRGQHTFHTVMWSTPLGVPMLWLTRHIWTLWKTFGYIENVQNIAYFYFHYHLISFSNTNRMDGHCIRLMQPLSLIWVMKYRNTISVFGDGLVLCTHHKINNSNS